MEGGHSKSKLNLHCKKKIVILMVKYCKNATVKTC